MNILKLIIRTNENYKETSIFQWLPKSKEQIEIKLDAIPIKYMDRQYMIGLSFPYDYESIHLECNKEKKEILKIDLIHCSDELNLALYSCDEYSDFTYTINDLRYKIPNEKYNDYIFNNNEEIKINHIDYYFKNLINDFLPPMAYLISLQKALVCS